MGVFQKLKAGAHTTKIQELNGNGTPGVSLTKDQLEAADLDIGEKVVVDLIEEEGKLEILFAES